MYLQLAQRQKQISQNLGYWYYISKAVNSKWYNSVEEALDSDFEDFLFIYSISIATE